MNKLILIFLIVLISSCQSIEITEEEKAAIEVEISNIISHDDKEEYLNFIFEEDQKLRKGQDADIMIAFGHLSKEHKYFLEKQNKQDAINLYRIEMYLKKHEFPEEGEFSELASSAIWAVVQHSNSYADRERLFPVLNKAYLEGKMEASSLEWILQRMHQMKFGERLEQDSSESYKAEDEVNRLIAKLRLKV